jgi:FtsP/CotA-like multicopper oxidase with cupredoxin domain
MLVVASGFTMLFGAGQAAAASQTFDLCALPGTATLTGSVTVPIWGFGIPTTPGDCSTATASLPGPQLEVTLSATETTTVTFNVTNDLPAGHSITFEIPGITFDAGPADADSGDTVSRSFTAPTSPSLPGADNAAGTYLYQSGGDAGRQEALGLYGPLIVRPSTPGQAYESDSSAYDVEAPLVLSQVDPAFNNWTDPNAADPNALAPNSFDMYTYRATYWLINGKAYPDTAAITAAAGQKVLLRYLNAGYDNTSMSLLGMHQQVLARDANVRNGLVSNPFLTDAETLPAGGTEDAIATMPAASSALPNGFPLFNRNLHLTNGSGPQSPDAAGGMLTFLHP